MTQYGATTTSNAHSSLGYPIPAEDAARAPDTVFPLSLGGPINCVVILGGAYYFAFASF